MREIKVFCDGMSVRTFHLQNFPTSFHKTWYSGFTIWVKYHFSLYFTQSSNRATNSSQQNIDPMVWLSFLWSYKMKRGTNPTIMVTVMWKWIILFS
jgi:hypothetical protein